MFVMISDWLRETHNDNGTGNGYGGHHFVGDGVCSVGVANGLIITVNSTLVWPVNEGHDDEWHRH